MSFRPRARLEAGSPFLLADPRAETREPSSAVELEGPFVFGEGEAVPAPARAAPAYVAWVQRALNQALSTNLSVDGRVGPATRSAVAQFQRRHQLNPDGIVGPLTEARLASASGLPTPGDHAGPVSAVTESRARYANWSDTDDRRKGRNPRDQDLVGASPQGASKVLEFPLPGDRSRRIFLLHNFKIDGASLRAEHKQYLHDLAKWMSAGPPRGWQVFAEAHASRTGTARHDDLLSEDRYLATRGFFESRLLDAGVAAARMRIYGEGVGFRHSPLPGEDPRARSVYLVVQPDPSPPPPAWPPPIVPVVWPPAHPTPVPVPVVAAPAPLPVAWLGIDRMNIVKTRTGAADTNWFGLLMDNSNLRLCGAYLEGTTFPGNLPAGQFPGSARDVGRAWVANTSTLRSQGWGTMFYYVGYSVGGGERLPSPAALKPADYATRGQQHARHAKTIVASISPALDGAVVFFDNEDGVGTDIRPLLPYYNAFFDELARPGPGTLPALRPGLYAHNPIARQFLAAHPEVFSLEVHFDTATTTTPVAPFAAAANPLVVGATATLHPMSVTTGTTTWSAWPVARQFRSYTGVMPAGRSRLAAIAGFTPQPSWDYDSAAVRDPAYPHGEPRLVVAVDAAGAAIVRGAFAARSALSQPRMEIDVVDSQRVRATSPPASELVEPDAPIVSATFGGATESRLATILQSNNLGVCDTTSLAWASTGSAASMTPRRLRALAQVAFAAGDFQVFFVGNDRGVYGIRSLGGSAWSAPVRMGSPLVVHPFGLLAAATRAGNSVDVFTIDDTGQLVTTWWSPRDTNPAWPGNHLQPLETAPSVFFPHTAIAAVSAAPNKLHVFAVGRDMRLRYLEFTNTAWSAIRTLGAATDLVSPHARIAAHAPTALRVEVAVTTDTGNVRVHTIAGAAGATWSETLPPVELANPDPAAPPGLPPPDPGALTESAFAWRINPFGDLAIASVAGSTLIYAAGIKPGATAALRRSLATRSVWERYR